MASADYESVLCVKNEVFVYRIPPRPSNRGYRAADWKLDAPDWTGRMRVVAKGKELAVKLEDKTSGELFAKCPVEEYPGIAVESVMDSSRYFVLRIKDDNGRSAFIGIGFSDRGDSFDLNVALQDHFKWLKQEEEFEQKAKTFDSGPKLDLGFKEGQTITLNIGSKKSDQKTRPRPNAGATPGLLPPPPGGVKIAPPPGDQNNQSAFSSSSFNQSKRVTSSQNNTAQNFQSNSNVDFLLDLGTTESSAPAMTHLQQQQQQQSSGVSDVWGDFTSASSNSSSSDPNAVDWVQF
ncbi:adaptin ear-binding coat-associated protein 1-like [Liolophura sinensis]|uniref:adaptin ear-binding coat-associated protein 1-like n=1 Tax=Liolophura sinensis TaxID=3198878 RepID=UPI0031596E57